MSKPKDLAGRMRDAGDGFKRETFTLPLEHARVYAGAYLARYPKAAYDSKVRTGVNLRTARLNSRCDDCRQLISRFH